MLYLKRKHVQIFKGINNFNRRLTRPEQNYIVLHMCEHNIQNLP